MSLVVPHSWTPSFAEEYFQNEFNYYKKAGSFAVNDICSEKSLAFVSYTPLRACGKLIHKLLVLNFSKAILTSSKNSPLIIFLIERCTIDTKLFPSSENCFATS